MPTSNNSWKRSLGRCAAHSFRVGAAAGLARLRGDAAGCALRDDGERGQVDDARRTAHICTATHGWLRPRSAQLRRPEASGGGAERCGAECGQLAWRRPARCGTARGTARGSDLSAANLQHAQLDTANLADATLHGADLTGAQLREAVLWGTDLSDAGLEGAQLDRANLQHADLSGARLRGASLRNASLETAVLRACRSLGRQPDWSDAARRRSRARSAACGKPHQRRPRARVSARR